MGKGQVRQMLLGESLLLVLATVGVTLTVGTLCGWFLSRTLAGMGVHYMVFQFPTGFALAYVAVLVLVPLVITGVSLHTFAKEPLVERLRGMEGSVRSTPSKQTRCLWRPRPAGLGALCVFLTCGGGELRV